MINRACSSAFIGMRTALFLTFLLSNACVVDEDLGPVGFLSSAAPSAPAVVTAACGPSPTSLAQVPNLQRGPLAIVEGALYAVGTDDAGATTDETLWRISMRDGLPTPVAPNQANIVSIGGQSPLTPSRVLSDGGLVWTSAGTGDAGTSGVLWELDGVGQASVFLSNRLAPGPIAFADGVVTWAEQGTDPDGGRFGALMQASTLKGDAPTILEKTTADQIPRAFALLPDSYSWVWAADDPAYGDVAHSSVIRAPDRLPFGVQIEVAGPDGGGVAGFAPSSDGGAFFFSTPTGIFSATPPAAPELLVPLVEPVNRLVDYGGALYFVEPMTGGLWAYPDQTTAGTGPLKQLAYDVDPLTALVADESCLYWIDPITSSVMMVQR